MSASRLYWSHDHGQADHAGVTAVLQRAPQLPGAVGITELLYDPDVRVAYLREGCDRAREMTALEIAACALILKRVAFAAQAALLEPIGRDLKA